MEVTPYGRRSAYSFAGEHGFWTGQGYAYLIVDARGIGGSGGNLSFMTDARRDGPQIVEWAARQSWSTGRVGMRGSSYSGTYPIQTAAGQPKGLACISPNASFKNAFEGPPFLGGALMISWALGWVPLVDRGLGGNAKPVDYDSLLAEKPLLDADVAAHGVQMAVYRQMLAHQTDDSFWARAHLSDQDYRRIRVPALAFTGWYDTQIDGSLNNYRAMRTLSGAANDQWLVVGPWDHAGASEGGYSRDDGQPIKKIGALSVEPNGFKPGQQMAREFFDWCLKGKARPEWPHVQMFVPGQNRWLNAEGLPVDGIAKRVFYLSGDGPANAPSGRGMLTAEPGAAQADSYVHDPANPVRADKRVGSRSVLRFGPEDISQSLARPDVLSYVTPPLDHQLTLLGRATLDLTVSTDAPDTDFVALLEDVAPDGSAVRLGTGWAGVLRARYRQGAKTLILMKPGQVTDIRIDLLAVGHSLSAGHRLRLSVMSSAYPFISVNPNTGNDIATDTERPRVAHQTLLRGGAHSSRLTIQVLEDHAPRGTLGRTSR